MRILSTAALGLLLAFPAAASTVTETTAFSSDWLNPSVIAAGTTEIVGTASGFDILQLSGLKSGTQMLDFTFSAADSYASGNLTAGGTILYSTTPFQWAWDQDGMTNYEVSYNSWNVGTPWFGSSGSLTSTANLTLGSDFAGGSQYLAIAAWSGSPPLSYTIGIPAGTDSTLAAVPLPATGLLLSGALALFWAGARARQRKQV